MSRNLTLSTKYRPKTFNEVSEQTSIKIILENQIKNNTIKHAYLFCGGAGTGKTTTARIIANMMNDNIGNPIEMDCASHNGVDDMRNIQEQCRTKPLQGKYKIFILDECVPGDTEILTDKGYKQFKDLDKTEKIAQYNDDGTIEFVKPIRYIQHHYSGDMYKFTVRKGRSVLMTPNHVQPLKMNTSGKIVEQYIKDCKPAQSNSIIVGGKGKGLNNTKLSAFDRLVIASQADGYMREVKSDTYDYNTWYMRLSKQTKIERILDLFNQSGVYWKEINQEGDVRQFVYRMPKTITKDLTDYFELDIGYDRALDILSEILLWDGSLKYARNSSIIGYYSSICKSNVDFVSAIATMCGYSSRQSTILPKKDSHNLLYEVYWMNTSTRRGQGCKKEVVNYDGEVYCVEVPSHKIIIRANGFTFITGNCHMITTAGWNSMLKILEEPPSYVIFLFCTTDPQKIPGTILSRVQRYNFSRISTQGIIKRLKYILEQEHLTDYEDAAIEYIARLAKGGMRDAITTLEKCLDYNNKLTLDVVQKVTSGGVTEQVQLNFLTLLLNNNTKDALLAFDDIYMSGIDTVLFLKLFIEFLENCVKYLITRNADIVPLSQITIDWLEGHNEFLLQIKDLLMSAIRLRNDFPSEDLKILLESWIVQECN